MLRNMSKQTGSAGTENDGSKATENEKVWYFSRVHVMGSSLLYLVNIDSVKRHQRAEGSLSNDDGDTVNDAWLKKKKKSYFTFRFRDCLDPIKLFFQQCHKYNSISTNCSVPFKGQVTEQTAVKSFINT